MNELIDESSRNTLATNNYFSIEGNDEDTIDEKGLLTYRLHTKDFENAVWMLIENENIKRWSNRIYSNIFHNLQSYVGWDNFEERLNNYLREDRFVITTPENFYVNNICELPNIETIVSEILPTEKHFMTILSKRDIATREKIYLVELKMFETFSKENFRFSVNYIHQPGELDSLIKNKTVLFHKRSIYATSR